MRLQRAGREWRAPCPFHAEKTPSFYINDQKAFFHCFGCGAHGDVVGFVMRHDGLAFPEAVEQLAGLAGMEMPRPEPAEQQKYDRLKLLADVLEAAAKWFEAQLRAPVGRSALAYLQGRGLDDKTIAEFRLGFAPPNADGLRAALGAQGHGEAELEEVGLIRRPDDGRAPYGFFRNRAMFPVTDKRGRVIAFGGRIMEGDGPKYVNSPEHPLFHKGSVLYGLARARAAVAKGARPIVVEGYMDVIAMQSAGFGGAVAPLGTALTEAQLAELWKAQTDSAARDAPPILCFDGDKAGRAAAERAVERILPLLGPFCTANVAFLPQGDDPDSMIRRGGAGAVQKVIDAALPMVDAVWESAMSGHPLNTPEQRAGLLAELETRIATIGDRSVQSLYRAELRGRFDALFPVTFGRRANRDLGRDVVRPFNREFGRDRKFSPPLAVGGRPPALGAAQDLHARVLLAAMLNHPYLFEDWSEEFASFPLGAEWEPLRQAAFEVLAGQALDAPGLADQLRASGYGDLLDAILGSATTGHATFVRSETPRERANEGWIDVLGRLHGRILDRELLDARSAPDRAQHADRRRAVAAERRATAAGGFDRATETVESDPHAEERAALNRAAARMLGQLAAPSDRGDEAGTGGS